MAVDQTPQGYSNETRRVRAALMNKVCGDEDMFALGTSVARVVQMASSDDQGTHDLAYYVLSDVALTQRILRLSNTATYRTSSGTSVTTISRAISLLGFDNVKTTALAMLLVDALSNSAHAQSVRVELENALCASLVGREVARSSAYQGAEEASIAALFKNLGPLLVATHEHARYREIAALTATGKHTIGQASQMILGCSYDTLSEAVMAEWKIPDSIVRSLAAPPPGIQKPAASRAEWMRQVAAFSMEVSQLLARTANPAATPDARQLLKRYGAALGIDADQMEDLFTTVQDNMTGLLQSMSMQPRPRVEEPAAEGLPNVLLLATMDAGESADEMFYPSGKPYNARELLLSGVQDVTQMRASGNAQLNDVVQAVLETLYRSMGFRFATVCLKDPRSGQFRARLAFGEDHQRRQLGFSFPMASSRDLFHLSMENDADLMIADAGSAKIRALLPAWHRALLPDARSFIVLPLVVGKVQLGLFYADRTEPAPEGVPPDETQLIKALKAQVLLALTP
ncbi:HDOD domain-containing protein [Massilia sp. R2A-15]|uniref:HDOD domain-containing protein n=1 Tax=Massilia sp. R2A-15 TaxID=3064278 RepID=UPI0027344923|nr:HDOD domain-containing protein [Massilia sp. R2A-15]WLI89321.1 HDOD domain-containing protein [Massilia sp. R2A-15]